ncbi:MAG: right-handed parallel beta-helix repeat-containing protein [Verrucomicrobia subdivision 3 bacterium]|nr:right-handed parallel beta-helix repeat-containing protein [Limisphaerales bacterium]
MFRRWISAIAVLYAFVVTVLPAAIGSAPTFTVEIAGTGASAVPNYIVRHGDDWRCRLGTNAPQVDWKTAADASLDGTWQTGPGGFGYEDGDDATLLTTMSNRFTTVYIRQSFNIAATPDTNQQLRLVMDWDDGFVAWLDGVQIARSPNAPGAAGTEPAFNALSLPPNHEASAGPNGNPPATYNLGRAADLLSAGTHVLAIMGLNGTINSSDLSLIADLYSVDLSTPSSTSGAFFSLVSTNRVLLQGSNTTSSARMTVNGMDGNFNIANGTWSKPQVLTPGLNRLFIASLDSSGNIVASISSDIIYESSKISTGGTLAADTTWSTSVVRVTNDIFVPSGVTLSISPGVAVLLSANASIKSTGGTIDAAGTEAQPVFFLPAEGATTWREVSAVGAGSVLNLRHVELAAGQVIGSTNSTVLIEDSYLHDLRSASRLFVAGTNATMTLRRSRLARYDQARFNRTAITIEDCLLEDVGADATDFSNRANLQIVRTTYRRGEGANTDAIDLGSNTNMLISQCLIRDFPDKGVSIADDSHGTIVRNSLLLNCGFGLSGYATSNLLFFNNTISQCSTGLFFRSSGGRPAFGTASNLIVWNNDTEISITGGSSLDLSYSDVEGGVLPGTGNISSDPQFRDPDGGDYRLLPGSPAIGAGLGGVDMGAVFPVGGIPPAPTMLAAHTFGNDGIRLSWQEDCDNEEEFQVERSTDATTWSMAGSASRDDTEFVDSGLNPGARHFYRIAAVNSSGKSRYSNIASGFAGSPLVSHTFVAGTLSNHTVWTPSMGMIIVRSNVVVPTNISLTLLEGTTVKITNGVSIRATAGGVINVLGSVSNKVTISRWNTNGNMVWTELSATGTNAAITVRHADISGGQTAAFNNAAGLFEDSYFHHYRTGSQPLLLTDGARSVHVRRCHFSDYYETLFRNGVTVVEDCLFENISGDGLDFDAAQPGTVLRRSTFRNGTLGNVDAVDVGNGALGGSRNVLIEDCLMYNFPFDKGVSVGDSGQSTGTVVRNCLMYGCLSGVQAKDNCIVTVYHCTIVDNSWGFTNYNKVNPSSATGGGHTVALNNILWDNRITISMANSGTLTAAYCDLGETNWPGTGNIDADPLFLDPAARDYRLAANSPCIGTGSNGVNMGVTFPVGGVPAAPINFVGTNSGGLLILDWDLVGEHVTSVVIEGSTNGTAWSPVIVLSYAASNVTVPATVATFFRVRALNFIGTSFASNVITNSGASDLDSDGMPDDWEMLYGFSISDPNDADEDEDSDGASNLDEYRAGTNPLLGSSRLGFDSVAATAPNQIQLTFTAVAGRTYAIQFRDSLTTGEWQDLVPVPAGPERTYSFTDTLPAGVQTRFYRLLTP